jgi:hypothetical protein
VRGIIARGLGLALLGLAAWSAVAQPWAWAFAIGVHPYPAGTPWTYQLLSGFLTDLSVLTVVASAVAAYRAVNCKWQGCPRIGHYRDSRGVRWCWRHHPDHQGQRPTGELLHRLHREHVARLGGRP